MLNQNFIILLEGDRMKVKNDLYERALRSALATLTDMVRVSGMVHNSQLSRAMSVRQVGAVIDRVKYAVVSQFDGEVTEGVNEAFLEAETVAERHRQALRKLADAQLDPRLTLWLSKHAEHMCRLHLELVFRGALIGEAEVQALVRSYLKGVNKGPVAA